jgi:hypothetical protein
VVGPWCTCRWSRSRKVWWKVGDKLNVVANRAKGDSARFKNFVESEGYATGARRGSVNTGGPGGTPSVDGRRRFRW